MYHVFVRNHYYNRPTFGRVSPGLHQTCNESPYFEIYWNTYQNISICESVDYFWSEELISSLCWLAYINYCEAILYILFSVTQQNDVIICMENSRSHVNKGQVIRWFSHLELPELTINKGKHIFLSTTLTWPRGLISKVLRVSQLLMGLIQQSEGLVSSVSPAQVGTLIEKVATHVCSNM